jgi:acetolactate synthase-1/2/3 large subunit
MERVAAAFGIHSVSVKDNDELIKAVEETLSFDGPAVCVVRADIQQKVLPKQSNYVNDKGQMESRPIEDMVPLLDREELAGIMRDTV